MQNFEKRIIEKMMSSMGKRITNIKEKGLKIKYWHVIILTRWLENKIYIKCKSKFSVFLVIYTIINHLHYVPTVYHGLPILYNKLIWIQFSLKSLIDGGRSLYMLNNCAKETKIGVYEYSWFKWSSVRGLTLNAVVSIPFRDCFIYKLGIRTINYACMLF